MYKYSQKFCFIIINIKIYMYTNVYIILPREKKKIIESKQQGLIYSRDLVLI